MRLRTTSACVFFVALLPLLTAHANEQKIIRLEQDVRDLERIVQEQARQIEELRRQIGYTSALPNARPRSRAPAADPAQWLNAESWDRVRPGMSEFEVLELLGPPNSTRTGAQDTRILLYALELAASGFLSGSITLQDRKVVSVDRPALK